jgi:polysaccharide biosynthesis protein PslH
MRCLWLTLADPEPRHNGQYVYSGGLIDSVAATGSAIEVLGLRRPDSPPRNGAGEEQIVWWLPGEPLDPLQSRWGSLASTLPHTAYRCRTAALEQLAQRAAAGTPSCSTASRSAGRSARCATSMSAGPSGHG